MNDLLSFKDFLIQLLTETRELANRTQNNRVRAGLDVQIALLARITTFIVNSIKEGTLDMEKAKAEIKVVESGTIETMGRSQQESPITLKIKEIAAKLKPGEFRKLDVQGIEYLDFSTRVYNLRSDDKLPQEVKPKSQVNGEQGIFLVKLTKEQMSAEPKRRTSNKE